MTIPTTTRFAAGLVGAGIIGCVTYAGVVAAGGIAAPQAPLLIALAAGLVVGAVACGQAWHGGRKALAVAMMATLLTGECYALLNIGERELESREARQAPKAADADRRQALTASITKGEAALAALTRTDRLENAMSVARSIERHAIGAAALPGCRKGCIETLEKGKAGAQRELEAARAELETRRQALEVAVAADRRALAAIPTIAALSPLAARVGVADWLLDLIRAGLFSVSANGLGAFLLAFAGHDGRSARSPAKGDMDQTSFALSPSQPENDGGPPKGGKRRRDRKTTTRESERKITGPSNVVQLPSRHPVISALESAGRTLSNGELANVMGCSDSEASKRVREVADLLELGWCGRYRTIALKSRMAAA